MTTIHSCRACDGERLTLVLSLGDTPLANSLVEPARRNEPEPRFPLDLVLCESCALLQITETVPPEVMFRDYRYFSSFSDTMLKHAATIADRLVKERRLGASSLAAEIASNDGYLLKNYVGHGVPVLGIEPARNVAAVAEEQGVRTIVEFFGRELGAELASKGTRADVLHANNVLAHVPDIRGVLAGAQAFLKDDGVMVIETPYVKPMLDHCEFDTIYHEHLFYWSITAFAAVARRVGLEVIDVEQLAIHGGSMRLFLQQKGTSAPSAAVTSLLAAEEAWGVNRPETYRAFATRVGGLKTELVALLRKLKAEGKSIAAYGAAAKGSTLLNHFGIGADVIDFVADRSTHKQGRLMPGVGIPIVAPEELLAKRPDYCVLLTWNFADEILAQQQAYRDAGGKFIVPVPQVVIR
ncbi:MAG: C-methyltransferase [Myxococcaceae bacterium]|nr:C-methyltransferase [Myxococcaceae bacterium]